MPATIYVKFPSQIGILKLPNAVPGAVSFKSFKAVKEYMILQGIQAVDAHILEDGQLWLTHVLYLTNDGVEVSRV